MKIKADVDTKRVRKQVKESVEREQPEVKPKLTMREQLQRMKDAFKYHFEIPNVHVESAKTVHQLHDEIVKGLAKSEIKVPLKLDDNVFNRSTRRSLNGFARPRTSPPWELALASTVPCSEKLLGALGSSTKR